MLWTEAQAEVHERGRQRPEEEAGVTDNAEKKVNRGKNHPPSHQQAMLARMLPRGLHTHAWAAGDARSNSVTLPLTLKPAT